MNVCAYYRGQYNEDTNAAIRAFAAGRGVEVSEILSDEPPRTQAFRRLQNYVKLGLCQALILPDRRSLGDDRWLIIENELFMRRNGVRLVYIERPRADHRYGLVNAIKAYNMPMHTWRVVHGDELPAKYPHTDPRRLPFGYAAADAGAAPFEKEAQVVAELFTGYAEGVSFGELERTFCGGDTGLTRRQMYAVLANDRYVGACPPSGMSLPGIVPFSVWARAAQRRGRPEYYRSRPILRVTSALRQYRCSNGAEYTGSRRASIDPERLEMGLVSFIAGLASCDPDEFYTGYVLQGLEQARGALPSALASRQSAAEEYNRLVAGVCSGGRSEPLQERISRAKDVLHAAGMRLRRIETEAELFSLPPEQVRGFFLRARRIGSCVRKEREFIAAAFIKNLRLTEDSLTAYGVSPASGRLVKCDLTGCLRFTPDQ